MGIHEPMVEHDPLRRYLELTEHPDRPLEALEAIRELRRHLLEVERDALKAARGQGISVHDCARALGMTRQAVYYKISRQEAGAPGAEDIVAIPEAEEPDPADRPSRSGS
ncbi:MAG TPA: hypothetical protein VID47_14990 [Actinomycetota bacterium]|jgi:DNA-binding NtrC family response regulator